MKIVKTVDRELTEKEIESINQFRTYTDGVSFACLRERVMVMIECEKNNDVEMLTETATDLMAETLCTHPDMEAFAMDDGHVLLLMPSGVCAFSEEACESNIDSAVRLRAECLDACEKNEIIAVVFEEE